MVNKIIKNTQKKMISNNINNKNMMANYKKKSWKKKMLKKRKIKTMKIKSMNNKSRKKKKKRMRNNYNKISYNNNTPKGSNKITSTIIAKIITTKTKKMKMILKMVITCFLYLE